jgi:carbon monoxide dehydrogenase subunit G
MPGAELTQVVDDTHWKATMSVELGAIGLIFDTDVTEEQVDEASQQRVLLSVKARELKNRGGAQATIESTLESIDAGTRVRIVTELVMSGAVAQYGRGIVQDVCSQLVTRFAACLAEQLSGDREEGDATVARTAQPVGGLRLAVTALWHWFLRLLRRGESR